MPLFKEHECARIDDISRMSAESIRSLAAEMGIVVTMGLANRVYQYAVEDVAHLKNTGSLV